MAKDGYRFETSGVVRSGPQVRKTTPGMGLSERPLGRIKCSVGEDYFWSRCLVEGEGKFFLMVSGYDIIRATNLLGSDYLLVLMAV